MSFRNKRRVQNANKTNLTCCIISDDAAADDDDDDDDEGNKWRVQIKQIC